jgi:hypothetical protein
VVSAGVGTDPLALVGRVLEQVAGQLAPDEVRAGAGETPPDELIVAVLANHLAQMLTVGESPEETGGSQTGEDAGWLAHYHTLLARNSVVAAALGACDCWGQDRDCPMCEGGGRPGWALPDERLYAAYVDPAVSAARRPRARGPANTQGNTGNERREFDDGQHVAR